MRWAGILAMTMLQCEFLDESLVTQHQGLRTTRGEAGSICTTYWWVVGNKGIYSAGMIEGFYFIVYWGCIGITEKKTETTIVYWGYTGIIEKKMETTRVYWGYTGIMENGNYYSILGIHRDNGKWKLL